ncbi:hypothetical protein OAU91_01275 [Flavobacteriaceae bacterium]|nr:hypothetical protein [Flavobacteriaceae bacterium]
MECKKSSCKDIKCKRYFLPLIFAPVAAIHPEIFNFYYFPLVVGVSAFILFWNFPKIVYYTASRPLYYEDLFIDSSKLPNYDVSISIKKHFQLVLEWVLIITNTLLVMALSDYWLYKTLDHFTVIEIVGITGGIIKVFQTVNNTISRLMLKLLRKKVKNENKTLKDLQRKKLKDLVNFKVTNGNFKINGKEIELIGIDHNIKYNRERLQTI